MELGRLVVSDFHSRADAVRAAEEFNRVVRRGEDPVDIETVRLEGPTRLDKLLARVGLAASVSEATRKIKEGAVELDHAKAASPQLVVQAGEHTLRLGKRFCRVKV